MSGRKEALHYSRSNCIAHLDVSPQSPGSPSLASPDRLLKTSVSGWDCLMNSLAPALSNGHRCRAFYCPPEFVCLPLVSCVCFDNSMFCIQCHPTNPSYGHIFSRRGEMLTHSEVLLDPVSSSLSCRVHGIIIIMERLAIRTAAFGRTHWDLLAFSL